MGYTNLHRGHLLLRSYGLLGAAGEGGFRFQSTWRKRRRWIRPSPNLSLGVSGPFPDHPPPCRRPGTLVIVSA